MTPHDKWTSTDIAQHTYGGAWLHQPRKRAKPTPMPGGWFLTALVVASIIAIGLTTYDPAPYVQLQPVCTTTIC